MNAARDEILECVQTALAGVERTPPAAPAPVSQAGDPLPDLFGRRLEDYGATVEFCESGDLTAAVHLALPEGAQVVVPTDLSFVVADARQDVNLSRHELDLANAVVTEAAIAIAETGTLVLDHGRGQGRRVLTLLPDVHVCVVRVEQIVRDVADALIYLDPRRPSTWISGPSATSDIELERVQGVHGPRHLHVLVVNQASGLSDTKQRMEN